MSPRIETVIENEAALHEFVPAASADECPCCTCGDWYDSGPSSARVRANFHQHQALAILAALKEARIAVVELPEPTMHSGAGDPVWRTLIGSESEDVYFEGDEVVVSGTCQLFADEARPFAASLLAAELFAAEASQ
ncbi:hypothetical protein [Mycolicibacterium peregrinum]|uniref:hypothetical protein n=1 Tax=Mycolicibacterium peregrinum TaxID=43304 RepID=UPI003AAA84FD